MVIHGGPDFDHEYLLPEMDRLAASFRLVYYDQRGRGRSFRGEAAADVTLDGEIADLDRVRSSTGVRSVAIVAHSFGAVLAMEYAIRHPDRVSHLILMNAAPASHAGAVAVGRAIAARRSPDEIAAMRALASDPGYVRGDVGPDAEYYRIHFGAAVRRREDLDRIIGRLRTGFRPEGIVAARAIEASIYEQTWEREDYDLLPSLRRLQVPTLVIHGDRDFIPLAIPREIAAAIPGARFLVLEDCGHFAFVEQPDAAAAAITSFVGPD